MDKLTFTVEITKALAWPSVVLVGIWTFRAPLIRLLISVRRSLRRVHRMKIGDVELEIAADAAKTAADAAKVEADKAAEKIVTGELPTTEKEQLLEQIKHATAKAERFETLYKEIRSARPSETISVSRNAARNLWGVIAAKIGFERIDAAFKDPSPVPRVSIIKEFRDQLGQLSKQNYGMLLNTGYIGPDNEISSYGWIELKGIAESVLAKRESINQ
ncbi:MAG: hypothetical protein AB7U71_02715 [Comamonas sp.]